MISGDGDKGITNETIRDKPSQVTNFSCNFTDCKKGFPTLKDLRRHRVVHTGSLFQCSYCNDFFGRRDHKLRHENNCHLRNNFNKVPDQNVSSMISGDEDAGITNDIIREKPSQVTNFKRCTNRLPTTPILSLPRYNCTSAFCNFSYYFCI